MTGLARSTTSAQRARRSATSDATDRGRLAIGPARAAGRRRARWDGGVVGGASPARVAALARVRRARPQLRRDGHRAGCASPPSTLRSSSMRRATTLARSGAGRLGQGAQDRREAASGCWIGRGGEQSAARLLFGLRGDLRHVAAGIGQLADAIERPGSIGREVGVHERRRPRSSSARPTASRTSAAVRRPGRRQGPGRAATRRRACRRRPGARSGRARRHRPRRPRRRRCASACRRWSHRSCAGSRGAGCG